MLITSFNPELDELERTSLSQYVAAAATSLTVQNNQGFVNTNKILVGTMGVENAELATINSAVTLGTTIPVAALTFPHNADEPIYLLRYDKVKFYRSTTGSSGTYSLLTTVDIDVDNADLQTIYDDTGGISTYYYKVSYYNSVTTYETEQSDPVQGSGYPRNTVGFLVNEILNEIRDTEEKTVTRDDLISWFNEVNDDLLTKARKPYLFLKRESTVNATADTYVPYPTDMWKFDRFEYKWTLGGQATTREFYPIGNEEFRLIDFDSNALSNDDLLFITLDDVNEVFKTYPKFLTTQTNAVTITYYKYFTEIDSPADVFETPVPNVYKLYAMAKYFRSLAKSDTNYLTLSDRYYADYGAQVSKLQRANDKNVGTPLAFKLPTRRMTSWRYR